MFRRCHTILFTLLFTLVLRSSAVGLDDWFARDSGTTDDLFGVAFGAEKFVAVGPAGRILISTSGVIWESRDSHTTNTVHSVTHGAGLFVAVGDNTVLVSSNANDWIAYPQAALTLRGVAYGSGRFVAVGYRFTGSNNLALALTSTNGRDWAESEMGVFNEVTAVTFGNGLFVAVTVFTRDILLSTNGVEWRVSGLQCYNPRFAVTYGKNRFVTVGAEPYCPSLSISVSLDGATWEDWQAGTNGILFGVAFGGGSFVAVGGLFDVLVTEGRITTSSDGLNWTPRVAPASNDLQAVAFGNATFVAVGRKGIIVQSGNTGPVNLFASRDPNSTALRLTVVGQPNWTYRLQSSTNLDANFWSDLTTLSNTESGVTYTNSFDVPQRFFRVVGP